MGAPDVFQRIVTALDRAGIPFMLTGSFASSLHGVTRATQDIDLVVAPNEASLRSFVAALPAEDYYVDLSAALEALRRRTQFNVVDLATGWKIDLMIRRDRPFSRREFERRLSFEYAGVTVAVATAEDVILAKLEWARESGSQRQVEDVVGILRLRWDELDRDYLERGVAELDLDRLWASALAAAKRG